MPLMPCATSPSAMPFTSSTCSPHSSAICSKESEVFSTSHTAVALGIRSLRSLIGALSETDAGHCPSRPRHARSCAGSAAYTAARLDHATVLPSGPQKAAVQHCGPPPHRAWGRLLPHGVLDPPPPTVATNPRSAIIFLSPPALSMAVQGDLL